MTQKNFKVARHSLIVSGVALYVLSLFLPAVRTKVWESSQTLSGLECLIWGTIVAVLNILWLPTLCLCLFSNLLMVLSLGYVSARKDNHHLGPALLGTAVVIGAASVWPDFFELKGTSFLLGYYLWWASFALVAAGLLLNDESVVAETPSVIKPL